MAARPPFGVWMRRDDERGAPRNAVDHVYLHCPREPGLRAVPVVKEVTRQLPPGRIGHPPGSFDTGISKHDGDRPAWLRPVVTLEGLIRKDVRHVTDGISTVYLRQ